MLPLSRSTRLRLANLWPPFRGMGIRLALSADALTVISTMKLRFWNRNIVGTQFGGGLYAMVDPLYMIILMENLGPDYVVWDKAATIRFKRPGRSDVSAIAHIPRDEVDAIREAADVQDRVEPTFRLEIKDAAGEVVAEVEKLLFVQRKDIFKQRQRPASAGCHSPSALPQYCHGWPSSRGTHGVPWLR